MSLQLELVPVELVPDERVELVPVVRVELVPLPVWFDVPVVLVPVLLVLPVREEVVELVPVLERVVPVVLVP